MYIYQRKSRPKTLAPLYCQLPRAQNAQAGTTTETGEPHLCRCGRRQSRLGHSPGAGFFWSEAVLVLPLLWEVAACGHFRGSGSRRHWPYWRVAVKPWSSDWTWSALSIYCRRSAYALYLHLCHAPPLQQNRGIRGIRELNTMCDRYALYADSAEKLAMTQLALAYSLICLLCYKNSFSCRKARVKCVATAPGFLNPPPLTFSSSSRSPLSGTQVEELHTLGIAKDPPAAAVLHQACSPPFGS